MPEAASLSRPPLALIASGHEWSARSFESILSPNGYAVLRAYTGRQALDQARGAQPDVIFLDASLSDIQGLEICRILRADAAITAQTPIFITTAGPVTRQERLDALRAGAFEFLGLPLDAEEMLLKLSIGVAAKIDADRARDDSLLDQLTGFYNVRGLLRRVRELGSDAFRYRRALACIVIAPEVIMEGEAAGDAGGPVLSQERLVKLLRDACRASDAVGRLSDNEFVVLAPNTDPDGAKKFAERLATTAEALEAESLRLGGSIIKLRIGFFAVPDFQEASIQPTEMLVRATTALRRSQSDSSPNRIHAFELRPPLSLS